jgi:hypothetical protein
MRIVDLAADPDWIADDVRASNRGHRRCNFAFHVPPAKAFAIMRELADLEASMFLEWGPVLEVEVEEALLVAAVATCLHYRGVYLRAVRPDVPSLD